MKKKNLIYQWKHHQSIMTVSGIDLRGSEWEIQGEKWGNSTDEQK